MNAEVERGEEEEEEGKEWGKAMSEDCLVLNVFAPSNSQLNFNSNTATTSPTRLKPVFIYIHGGGFVGGSAGTARAASLTAQAIELPARHVRAVPGPPG